MHDLAQRIFAVEFPPPIAVPTPEWPAVDGRVFVRAISAAERDAYEMSLRDDEGESNLDNVRARLVTMAACDGEGKRLFGDADAASVGKQPAAVVYRLWDRARRLAGMLTEEEGGALAGLVKNSAATGEGGSPSS